MKSPMTVFRGHTFQKMKHALTYGIVVETVGRKLVRKGFVIKPYYIFREGLDQGKPKNFSTGFTNYEIGFLAHGDMKDLHRIDGRDVTESTMKGWLDNGCKCLALKIEGRIAGFTWCRFDVFDYPPMKGFALSGNEACLFDMYILKAYRGANLAPFLRYCCYRELAGMGRTALYSNSDIFNTSAIRFKNKLHARILGLWLYVRMGKAFSWNWKVRSYEGPRTGRP